jgi:hypothetical protein
VDSEHFSFWCIWGLLHDLEGKGGWTEDLNIVSLLPIVP